MENEIWKDIPGYEGLYMVSNIGRVKGLDRIINCRGDVKRKAKGIMLKGVKAKSGYLTLNLNISGKRILYCVHQLVAMAFLDHAPCRFKLVVNHINFDKEDNRVENLEVVTNRKNSDKKHLTSASKYVGVSKARNKWSSCIEINNKTIRLGTFDTEIEASEYYQNAILDHERGKKIRIRRYLHNNGGYSGTYPGCNVSYV